MIDGDRPVRWGIVATGGMSRTFVGDLAATPGCEVIAVGSRSAGTARSFAEEFGIAHAYGSYEDLAADDDVDVVYVGATHNAHYRAARAGLDAGRAVLCEKPLTVDAAQATDLVDIARQRRLFLMEALWTLCQPGWLALVVFAGPDGRVTVPSPFNQIIAYRVERSGEPARTVPTPVEGAGYVHMAAEVVRCLRAGLTESPLVPLNASLATMAVLDDARREIGLVYPWEAT